jgi:hypothetical protein
MRRSRKLYRAARREALLALMFLGVCCTLGVWAAAVGMGEGSGGALPLMLAAAAVPLVWIHAGEAVRLAQLAWEETWWEELKR